MGAWRVPVVCLWLSCLATALPVLQATEGHADETCKPCRFQQGAASFGVFDGDDKAGPLKLRPIDLLGQETDVALPLANPVLNALELTEQLSSQGSSNETGRLAAVDAIAHPTLAATDDGRLLMFFATHACGRDRWGIAAAESPDGRGLTWRGLGMVLEDEHTDLHAPSLFRHNGSWYLALNDGQEVRLFKAKRFPLSWELAGALIMEPLAANNVVHHDGRWWLLGHHSDAGRRAERLAIYEGHSPLGPWTRRWENNTAFEGATSAGTPFVWAGSLHFFTRSCHAGSCGSVNLARLVPSAGSLEQEPVQLAMWPPMWRQRASWDSAGWTHVSVGQRPDGTWLAVAEASQLPPVVPLLLRQLQAAIVAFRVLALVCIVLLLMSAVTRLSNLRPWILRQRWVQPLLGSSQCSMSSRKLAKSDDGALPRFLPPAPTVVVQLLKPVHGHPKSPAYSLARQRMSSGSLRHGDSRPAARRPCSWWRQRLPPWRLVVAMLGLLLAVLGAVAVRRVQRIAQPFFVQPQPLPVGGQWSRFTLMVMSYDARLRELQWYVRHYSQCPSVGEILVVWNRGPPPGPSSFVSDVPVRVRLEAVNSMNNRFRPDPEMKFRSVLSLDDDILMPCTTVESTFARWRRTPQQLAGFYPRLLLPEGGAGASGPPVYQFEEFVFQQGQYNTILAGAAFMDSATFFPLYFSDVTAPARALVDEVFNCDDLLLNFVVANWTRGLAGAAGGSQGDTAAVQLVRPERRIDISRLSGVGISHNPSRFKAAADRCLGKFTRLFSGCPLQVQSVGTSYQPPNCKLWPLDCMYL